MKNVLKLMIITATLSFPLGIHVQAQGTDTTAPGIRDTVSEDDDDMGKWGLAGLLGLLGLLGLKRNDRNDRHSHTTNR